MEFFHVPIFPEGSLANSVTTTIWLGVCVTAFFNLRFGWALSGLVIPGYLAPLCLIKPWASAVILLEGVLTYYLVYWSSERLAPKLGVVNFFGRDRFFALLVASVVVRLALDGLVLPAVGQWVNEVFHLSFDYRGQLHSFGLIIVALIANQFWKPGFLKGISPLLVNLFITYALTVYVLIPFTNFNLSSLNYMYEDLATSLLASPKGYVIILTTSLIASRFNLLYGFEYSGILIPSLLALQWYQPIKLVATFIEVFIILFLAKTIINAPGIRSITMEGARKILLFFNISFLYKIFLGFALTYLAPQLKVSDYYGFGYLLPSLLAIKMYDKKIALKVTRVTIQTSLTALIFASGVGYALTIVPWSRSLDTMSPFSNPSQAPQLSSSTSMDQMQYHKVHLYGKLETATYQPPLPMELEAFHVGLLRFKDYLETWRPTDESLSENPLLISAQNSLGEANFQISKHSDSSWSIQERGPRRGWGVYFIFPDNDSELLLTAPGPLEEWGVMESAMELANGLSAKYVSLGGVARKANLDGSSDPLKTSTSCLRVFQQVFGKQGVIQVRGYFPIAMKAWAEESDQKYSASMDENSFSSGLWISRSVPRSLGYSALEKLVPGYDLHWKSFPLSNILRDSFAFPYGELFLSRTDRRRLFFQPAFQDFSIPSQSGQMNLEGYLQDWLLDGKLQIAPSGSNAYRPPTLEEMLYMDQEVITPIYKVLNSGYLNGQWTEDAREELQAISRSALVMDYQLILYRHIQTGADYLILQERKDSGALNHWGVYAFRPGASRDFLVAAPRPLYEASVFEYSVSLFENLQAKALLIAGAHPDANSDGTSDVIREEHKVNLFNLVHQVFLRESTERAMLSVFCRAFGYRPDSAGIETDAIVAFNSGIWNEAGLSSLSKNFVRQLKIDGWRIEFADGSKDVASYDVGSFFPARYLSQTEDHELALLWLSPLARTAYRRQDENWTQNQQFEILGISQKEGVISELAAESSKESSAGSWTETQSSTLRELCYEYVTSQDITLLQNIKQKADSSGELRLERWIDINSKQAFLVWLDQSRGLRAMVNLTPKPWDGKVLTTQDWESEDLKLFLRTRDFWMERSPSP